ncbi:hypothetical protein sscle_11g083690 [Sclerotinia sclerotiorum 1980 UF-70]|uniref:Amino acid permease/ SLC12A domain-containing protein n=1 Tax=Sclerotinia sclerotiorum (strain ATCC 18683 / 1980 / Ss-1) TaxID=665079 RepID=A0A1D9QFD6_SCLS1|nr:hypothetical protein sscle_11g083690 [Sclerotinia sclerotiorum 1980 UF-70]
MSTESAPPILPNETNKDSTNSSEKMKERAHLAPEECESGLSQVQDSKSRGSTRRGLKSRHAQMIALGGTIGTGLFVGTGQALSVGGPGFLFLAYCLETIFVYGIVTATTEISAYMPAGGSTMASYATRYVSPSLGFAMGWLYWYSFAIIVPYEITAAGLVVNYWPNDINIAVWITVLLFVIIGLNFFPVKVYGETEFWFASLKVFMIVGLLILSFILFWSGGPSHRRLGFHYWKDPGATKEYLIDGAGGRFCALLYVLVFSAFSFSFAPELLVITGGEMESPRRNLPTAAKRYFYRLLIFYIGGTLAIGVIVSSNAPGLIGGGPGASSSPWVIAIKNAGISGLDSVVNAVIITSAWSSGNSFLYMSSRSLYSLALFGNAPRVFKTCNRWGVPYPALIASSLLSLLAYLNCARSGVQVFNWFINLTNTSGFISWICCCIVFFRFRKACAIHEITDLPYKSRFQPYLAYVSICAFTILLLCNGFSVFFHGKWNISSFLTAYIGLPVFLAIYIGHRIYYWSDEWMLRPADVDMTTGLEEVLAIETATLVRTGRWYHNLGKIWA